MTHHETELTPGTRVRITDEVFPGALNRIGTVIALIQDLGGHRGLTGVRVALDATPTWHEHEHDFLLSSVGRPAS